MRVFGTKQVEPTDEDRIAAARLSAVAARFRPDSTSGFTDVTPDPIGEPAEEIADPEEAEEPETDE